MAQLARAGHHAGVNARLSRPDFSLESRRAKPGLTAHAECPTLRRMQSPIVSDPALPLLLLLAIRSSGPSTLDEIVARIDRTWGGGGVNPDPLSAPCSDLLDHLHREPRFVDKSGSSVVTRLITGESNTIWGISESGRTVPLSDLAVRLDYAGPVPSSESRSDVAWCAVLMMRMHGEQSEERISHLAQTVFGRQMAGQDGGVSAELVRDVLDKLRANRLATNQGRFRTSWTIEPELSSKAPLELREHLEKIWPGDTPPQTSRPGMPQTVAANRSPASPTRHEQPSPVDQRQLEEMRRVFSWERIQQAIVQVLSDHSESGSVAYRTLADEVWQRMERPPEDRSWTERPGDLPLFEFRVSRGSNTLRAVDVVQSAKGMYSLTPLGTGVSPAMASRRCTQHISLWRTSERWTAEQWRDWSREQGGYPDWYLCGGSVEETTVAPVRRARTSGEAPTVAEQITIDVVRDYLTVLGTSWKSAQSITREIAEMIAPETSFAQRDDTERQQIHKNVTDHLEVLQRRERADRRDLDPNPAFDMWRLGAIGRIAQIARDDDDQEHMGTAPTWPAQWAESVIRVLRDQGATTEGKALLAKRLNDAVAADLNLPLAARSVFSLTYPTQYEYQTRIDAVRRFLLVPRGDLEAVLERHEQGKDRLWNLTTGVPSDSDLPDVLTSVVSAHFWKFAESANYKFEPEFDDILERASETTDIAARNDGDAKSEPARAGASVATGTVAGSGDGPDKSLTNALLDTIRAEVSGEGFEYLWALVMAERGYRHVEVRRPGAMGRRGDGGLDILAHGEDEDGWSACWVQVKNRKNPAEADDVRSLSGAVQYRGGRAMFVSVSGFVVAAEQNAAELDVELLGGAEIATWMTDAGVGVRVSGQKMVVDREWLVRFGTRNRDELEAVWSEEYFARKKSEGESVPS